MNFRDLMFVNKLLERDYQTIKNNIFFIKLPNEFNVFEQIKNRIINRIKNLVIVCGSYFWTLSLENTSMICLMLFYLKIPNGGILVFALCVLFITILALIKAKYEESGQNKR